MREFLILDTETTGLDRNDEIIELCIINQNKEVLFNKRFKPQKTQFIEATNIHHINYSDLIDCSNFNDSINEINEIFSMYDLCYIYNSDFDLSMIRQTQKIHKSTDIINLQKINFCCVMLSYCDYINERKWQKLIYAYHDCCKDEDKTIIPHSALGDCLMTLEVINTIFNNSNP